jgi:hypothetical protein
MTIVCDANGEFSTDIKLLKLKVRLSAIGYQERACYLSTDRNRILRLTPVNNVLPDVSVSSKAKKRPNAYRIIKKVNKHIEQNYGDFSFDQRFKNYSFTRNYDTTKGEMDDLIDLRFNKDQRKMQIRQWHHDTANYDAVFFRFVGVPRLLLGDIIPLADILRREWVIGEKHSKGYDFKLLEHYEDRKYGAVYHVSFRPNTRYSDSLLGGRTIGYLPLGYLKGEMLITEDDYAVVDLKYIWEAKVERLNEAIERLYQAPSWKANRVGKIISNAIIYKFDYSYSKDAVTGKYFVQTIKADCFDTGYQIESNRKVQLYYQFDATSLGVENIVE